MGGSVFLNGKFILSYPHKLYPVVSVLKGKVTVETLAGIFFLLAILGLVHQRLADYQKLIGDFSLTLDTKETVKEEIWRLT